MNDFISSLSTFFLKNRYIRNVYIYTKSYDIFIDMLTHCSKLRTNKLDATQISSTVSFMFKSYDMQ